MKSLQEYIIEEYEINEGKLWDAIKKWFLKLFNNDSDKKFNPYADNYDEESEKNLKNYIDSNFKQSNILVKPIDKGNLKSIVMKKYPVLSEENNTGFWRFKDEFHKDNEQNIKYFVFLYDDENVENDAVALLKCKLENNNSSLNYLEVKIEQILNRYENLFKMNDLFYKFKNDKLMTNYKGLIIYKDKNKALYNKALNDCNFEKITYNGKTAAILKKGK